MDLPIPGMVMALAVAILVAALLSLLAGPRGGRYRALPGWVGFWVLLGSMLVCLSLASPWVSLPVLAILMFAALKEYFFLAPLRPHDRRAILAAYVSIPITLYAIFMNSYGMFLAAVLLYLFLFMPALLSAGTSQPGLLDSMGRVLLGILVFVFCTAHLGWLVHQPGGQLELFGVLVLASELPQRLTGRMRWEGDTLRPVAGFLAAVGLAVGLGAWLGPMAQVLPRHGMAAGLIVSIASSLGALVGDSVVQNLALKASASRVGRAAFLERTVPAVYAAPLYFHYVRHFL